MKWVIIIIGIIIIVGILGGALTSIIGLGARNVDKKIRQQSESFTSDHQEYIDAYTARLLPVVEKAKFSDDEYVRIGLAHPQLYPMANVLVREMQETHDATMLVKKLHAMDDGKLTSVIDDMVAYYLANADAVPPETLTRFIESDIAAEAPYEVLQAGQFALYDPVMDEYTDKGPFPGFPVVTVGKSNSL